MLELEPEEAGGGCSGAWDVNAGRAVGRIAPTPVPVVGATKVPGVTCVPWVFSVGRGGGVLVGAEVGVAVGGTVAVGMASWVSATMVNAAACAVCCTSAGFIVGVA